MSSSDNEQLLPNRGNYTKLLSYQKAEVVYRITCFFCARFLNPKDRTVDQMVQAARSGKQNIVEGCEASSTSSKTEIKLINVAKASLRELHEDYCDYLKTHGHELWQPGDERFEAMRRIGREHNDAGYFMNIIETRPPETIANMAIILLNQADYLLHRQLQSLSQMFLEEGGMTERMYRLRKKKRDGN